MTERELEKQLKALANRRRLLILTYLKGHREAAVGDISDAINLSFKATSKHLGVLAAADIVDKEQRSLQMWYRLSQSIHHVSKYISNSLE